MKIKEAVDIINGTLTVKAMYNEHSIFMCYKHLPFDNHCFLTLRADTRSWGGVTLVSSTIDGVIPQDLARVMDVVQRLIDTPVKDRFPERKYYLCVFPKKEALKRRGESEAIWVNHIGSFDDGFRIDYGPKTAFTEEMLNTIKESLPFIASAIDTMKEPVEDE